MIYNLFISLFLGKVNRREMHSQIAKVFKVDRTIITKHINKIFRDQELDKKVVCAKFAHTTPQKPSIYRWK